MTWSETTVIILIVLATATWLAINHAQRLDRLHRKVVASRLALDAQLLRRSAAAGNLAASHTLDPVSSLLLADTVNAVQNSCRDGDQELMVAVPDLEQLITQHRTPTTKPTRQHVIAALDGTLGQEREAEESSLTAVLTQILDEPLPSTPDTDELLNALAAAWYRVHIARRFHNEAVLQAQRLRANPFVRLFRLAGRAPMPQTVEFDDTWPPGLPAITGHLQ
ncbi:hypothetical protein [Jonesia denitrificans]|uniref:LemA family protein n=1 Tax=Jonesia denitrificans (strain ATCC 14870 / DSM 20603 / BCRC 15368 / CIP 55.134 / JCM 11481 / NBRC 15587 / NCTC 10816 / Prevot 55134) TaxID=471856 RepID=C7R4H2_JONDD|nr:hypothetical protein [Jonesia denitrificans]ACV09029.1 hypothetical protein Jden_1373 [Jonesia denitrificans DSM 20603]ASE09678.1 hypothetical protein CEP80_11480 [Jonesia denitrificans]QXB44217.1 hypothetical protein I6L70_05125 [Jonesia denitrificans]SQH21155.1 Uncharacterised protein [Jonesia denitrificans]